MRDILKEYINLLLKTELKKSGVTVKGSALKFMKNDDEAAAPDNLLVEPDDPDFKEEKSPNEASGAGAVAGVTVPLGAGPTYPSRQKKKRRQRKKSSG